MQWITSAGKRCGCFLIYLLNKVKEISYKIIKFYPAKHYIKKNAKVIFPPVALFVMTLLKLLSKTVGAVHLQRHFGKMFKVSFRSNIYNECILFWKDVVLGFIEYEQFKRKLRWPRELNALQLQKTYK